MLIPIFLMITLINVVSSQNQYQRLDNIEDIRGLLLDDPSNIGHANINITRDRNRIDLQVCCINILGEDFHCSIYDLEIEYLGKLTSQSVMIDCPQVLYIDYRIERKLYVGHIVSITIGLFVILSLAVIAAFFIIKKNKKREPNAVGSNM